MAGRRRVFTGSGNADLGMSVFFSYVYTGSQGRNGRRLQGGGGRGRNDAEVLVEAVQQGRLAAGNGVGRECTRHALL